MSKKSCFSGIIFDFNGVLWWDEDLQDAAWREFSAAQRGRPFTAAELARYVHGRTNADTLAYLHGSGVENRQLAAMTAAKEGIYQQLCLQAGAAFRLSPGTLPLLESLLAARIPFTIATASEKGNLDFFWRHLQLGRWFDRARVVYDDGTLPGKPAPDMYRRAAAQLELPPESCVVVEDSLSGLQAAAAAGIGHIVALKESEKQAALARQTKVDRFITALDQLPLTLFGRGDQELPTARKV